MTPRRPAGAERLAAGLLLALGVATVVGLVALWPGGGGPQLPASFLNAAEEAEVTSTATDRCPAELPDCRLHGITVLSGPQKGERGLISLAVTDASPTVDTGDHIRVLPVRDPALEQRAGTALPRGGTDADTHLFVEFERGAPLLWLAVAFAGLTVVLGRRQGARSLVALGLSLLLLTQFVVPAILDGRPPLLAALVGSFAVMIVTTLLTHGAGPKSVAAMLSSAGTLLTIALLAVLFVDAAHITGFFSGEATLLSYRTSGDLSPSGLVLAGIVIGALGVLDDITVSQASTVMALRRANPAQGFRRLYDGALSVGRDHLGAAVNTLVLAYAGAALPVLLIFSTQQTSFRDAVNREPVAEQIVATLVGSIGLIAAVPLTTAIAALLASRLPAAEIPEEHHGHHH